MDYFDHSTCEEKVSISSTRLNYENFTFRVLDLSIKISHFEYSKVDLVSGRSKLVGGGSSIINKHMHRKTNNNNAPKSVIDLDEQKD